MFMLPKRARPATLHARLAVPQEPAQPAPQESTAVFRALLMSISRLFRLTLAAANLVMPRARPATVPERVAVLHSETRLDCLHLCHVHDDGSVIE